MLYREACIAWSMWEEVHRQLVAVEFRRMQVTCDAGVELRLALLDEQTDEPLLLDG